MANRRAKSVIQSKSSSSSRFLLEFDQVLLKSSGASFSRKIQGQGREFLVTDGAAVTTCKQLLEIIQGKYGIKDEIKLCLHGREITSRTNIQLFPKSESPAGLYIKFQVSLADTADVGGSDEIPKSSVQATPIENDQRKEELLPHFQATSSASLNADAVAQDLALMLTPKRLGLTSHSGRMSEVGASSAKRSKVAMGISLSTSTSNDRPILSPARFKYSSPSRGPQSDLTPVTEEGPSAASSSQDSYSPERLPGSSSILKIPGTPFMTQMAEGSGISVYSMERTSPTTGAMRSPWIVKKVDRREEDVGIRHMNACCLQGEAEILRQLRHPNIIGYRGFERPTFSEAQLVMEAASDSLGFLIHAQYHESHGEDGKGPVKPFSSSRILRVAKDVALALKYLHDEAKLIHCDIKPGNVLVFGDFQVVKLGDFGSCQRLAQDGTIQGNYEGTKPWWPMEVYLWKQGKPHAAITPKADIYAYGLCLHQMVVLKMPHWNSALCAKKQLTGSAGTDDQNLLNVTDDDGNAGSISTTESPYCSSDSWNKIVSKMAIGTRPNFLNMTLDSSYRSALTIIEQCTDESPDKRPRAKNILNFLMKKTLQINI